MPRKKIPSTQTDTELAAELDDLTEGEQIIIQDTRTIEKKTRREAPKVTEVEDDDDDDDDDEQLYPDNSLAALMQYGDESPENQMCSVIIRRNPDELGDRWINPCRSLRNLPVMRNIQLSADRFDLEEIVRNEYGGGHYFFQIQFAGRIGHSWKATLADSAVAIEKAKQAEQPAPAAQPQTVTPAAPPDPLQTLISGLTLQKQLKELMFGDELEELKRLREKEQQPPPPAPEPPNEKIAIIQYAEKITSGPLQEKVLGMIFEEDKNTGGILDLVKWGFENQESVFSAGEKLLGLVTSGLSAAAPAPNQSELENFLKTTPPGIAPTAADAPPPTSNFKRRKQKPAGETKK